MGLCCPPRICPEPAPPPWVFTFGQTSLSMAQTMDPEDSTRWSYTEFIVWFIRDLIV